MDILIHLNQKLQGVLIYKTQVFSLASILYRVYFYSYVFVFFYCFIINFFLSVYFINKFFFLYLFLFYFLLFIIFCKWRSSWLLINDSNYDKNKEIRLSFPIYPILFILIFFIFFNTGQFFFFYWIDDILIFFSHIDQPTFEIDEDILIDELYYINPVECNPRHPNFQLLDNPTYVRYKYGIDISKRN